MLTHVYCGFQTGVDQAGARAARSLGLATGGYMPLGYRTEDGPRPEFAGLYGALEHHSADYPPRTAENVKLARVTVWYGPGDSAGFRCTRTACHRSLRPFLEVGQGTPEELARVLALLGVGSVNVAGPRESRRPGIGAEAEAFFAAAFLAVLGGRAGAQSPGNAS